jgi:hypothetical protein
LENLSDSKDINKAWENIQTSATDSLILHEFKQHKPWSDDECLGFFDQRKQAKMQWVQDPSQNNVDNLNNVRHEGFRHLRGGRREEYLKAKIDELETDCKIKNIRDLYRGINYIMKGYQLRTDTVKVEKGDLVADSHSISARRRNYFSKLSNVHGVNDVRHTEIYTAEPRVPEPSTFQVELSIEKLKSHT